VQALADNFPGSDPIPGSLKEMVPNPKRVRLFRASDAVTTTNIQIQLPRGELGIQWILPKHSTVEMMEGVVDRRAKPKTASGNPKEIVERMPVEIVGLLGEITLSLNQLASMKSGDVFVLNQKIDEPLVALIDGKPYYECWPGRIGNTQGLEISTCL
jgi:flagellar motor switch protein FliM